MSRRRAVVWKSMTLADAPPPCRPSTHSGFSAPPAGFSNFRDRKPSPDDDDTRARGVPICGVSLLFTGTFAVISLM